ncbi:MAG TPA: hypothetical protein VFT13_06615, partial [Candidatus Krumholzibacteria bacterium]|nr:hypothetical protein [Candidatus Krumholzibacteria bacterium]
MKAQSRLPESNALITGRIFTAVTTVRTFFTSALLSLALCLFLLSVSAALTPAVRADPPDSTGTFSVTPPVAIDWSGEKTETLFFILGMLDEYLGRQWTEDVDCVERFYCSEHVEAFVFLAYLNRLASEQGLDPVIDTELNDCLVYFHSKPLADLINS